jgi:hypothetical protein
VRRSDWLFFDADQGSRRKGLVISSSHWKEDSMIITDHFFLALVVGSFSVFGIALAITDWYANRR